MDTLVERFAIFSLRFPVRSQEPLAYYCRADPCRRQLIESAVAMTAERGTRHRNESAKFN